MAGRYSGGIPQRSGGANRFGFRPSGGDSSRNPCQGGPCSAPSSAISGAALPQTRALLQKGPRQTCVAPKPRATQMPAPPQRGAIARPGGPSRMASAKPSCPCPPQRGAVQRPPARPQPTTVPCPARSVAAPPPQVQRQSGLRPPGSGIRPPGSGIRPPGSGLRPPASGLRPPGSGIRPPGSGLRPPGSGMRPPASGMRPPASAGLPPPCSAARSPQQQMRPPAVAPPSRAIVPCPARGIAEDDDEGTSAEDIISRVRQKLERKEVEERDNVLSNLEDMQNFRRQFILGSLPQRRNPFTEGEYRGYTGEFVTQEMLEGRYCMFKRTKDEFFSGASESDDDLDKIEPDFLVEEEEEEEEEGGDLEEFLSCASGGRPPPCRTIENRSETYSEELFRVMKEDDE